MRAAVLLLSTLSLASGSLASGPPDPSVEPPPFNDPFASFSVRVGTTEVRLREIALSVQPGASVPIEAAASGGRIRASSAGGGRLRRANNGRWTWSAPTAPGFHEVVVTNPVTGETIRLTFMVLTSASEVTNGQLNGYRIGRYLPRPASRSRVYEPPVGFIEARPGEYDRRVSPNFRLRDFLCKDPGDPRYVLVSPRLLEKLEALLVAVNEEGYATSRLTVMSGFRTPAYNRAIGNTTDLSRHLWGDAADVFVDNDGDGQMDDLNGDGVVDVRDARWMAQVMERAIERDPKLAKGGLAVYRRNAVRGPFLHVDARGQPARW